MLLGLTGKLESGKSTLAKQIQLHHKEGGVYMMAFAKPLKDMCQEYFGFTYDDLYTPDGKKNRNALWDMTTREFMQRLGQGLRDAISPDVWVTLMECRVMAKKDIYPLIIIDDARMPNELNMIHRLGGKVIRVTRPGHIAISHGIQNHPSEQDLPDELIDYDLVNDSTPEELYNRFHLLLPNV